MKVALILVTFVAAVWAYPQQIQHAWKDFPMKRMYVDPEGPSQHSQSVYPDSRILQGDEVEPNTIPYQTWMIFWINPLAGGWTCGGSLITKKFVLTAAHCSDQAEFAEVYLGMHNITANEPNTVVIRSARLITHPDFDGYFLRNDVALIELEEEVELNEFINVVRLPPRSDLDNLFEDRAVRVSGWGLTAGDANDISYVLFAVNSTVLPNNRCRAVFYTFLDTQVCISNEGGVGACHGDSGGPLVAGDAQIGIVSYGPGNCAPGPTVFTRITSFFDWIVDNSDYVAED